MLARQKNTESLLRMRTQGIPTGATWRYGLHQPTLGPEETGLRKHQIQASASGSPPNLYFTIT